MSAAIATILARADARLRTHEEGWRSLGPGRERASSLEAIGERVLSADVPLAVAGAWAEGLAEVATAMQDAFPENVFWDLDRIAADLLRAGEASGPVAGAREVRAHAARLVEVQRVFGRHTPVAFRYVHDFSYGFDWAKWVGKEPDARRDVSPFGPRFVQAMIDRGRELHSLIAEGRDAKYPPLPDGRPRNPFGFSREPEAEARLLRHLAAHDLLPVRAWDVGHVPTWDRPYAALRRQAAQSLRI